jgi:outer-membrane receptor for ferric coprogen and ferric-rhodotorulic acid
VKIRAPRFLLLLLLAASSWTLCAIASAATLEPGKYQFEIGRQPLGLALQELAKQSGVQIIFFSQVTEGLQAPALKGRYTLSDALEQLLARSRLDYRVINAKTIEIRLRSSEDPSPAGAVAKARGSRASAGAATPRAREKTTAAENASSLDEITVNGTAEGLVATRTATPLREIPQTIAIISREQMRQQNDTDLADALSHAVGITAVQSNSLSQTFISRGFTITTYHVDGGAALNSFGNTPVYGTPDLGEYDHIEVLRGSDALFGGIGNPGATVNLIRKRPLAIGEVTFSANAGSWNNYRAEADATGPIGFDGAVRARLDLVLGDRDYFFQPARLGRRKVFGALEFDVTSTTLLTLGASYQWDHALPVIGGLPSYPDGSDARLPRSLALSFNWSRYDTQTREYYVQFQQAIGSVWKLKLNATSLDAAAEYNYGAFDSPINPTTKVLPILPYAFFSPRPNIQDQFAFDGTLTGSFEVLNHRFDVAVGGDYQHFKGDIPLGVVFGFEPAVSNVFQYTPAAYPRAPTSTPAVFRSQETTNQRGEFASARVYLSDKLSLVGGARVGSSRLSNTVSLNFAGLVSNITLGENDPNKVTPFAGATYDLSPNYSLYASYADVYVSNGNLTRIGGALVSPIDGIDREVGIKGTWRNYALNGFLVLYDIEQRGIALPDPNATRAEAQSFSMCCNVPAGINRSKGVDVEINGALMPGWLIGAGYTFNYNHYVLGGDLSSETPRHLFKLWSSTQLQGDLERWSIGGGLHAQSRNYGDALVCPNPDASGACFMPEQYIRSFQGSFAVADLRAAYEIDPHWHAALSVNNVFDRVYYQSIGSPLSGNWYGAPREFVLRIDGKY